jgi:hypothetical protein
MNAKSISIQTENATSSLAVATALLEALVLMGQEHSDQTIRLMLDRLAPYPKEHVIRSLRECEKKCRRIYLVDIINNLPRKPILHT